MHVNSSTDYLNTRPNVGFLGDKGSRLCFAVIILGALSFSLFVSVLVLAARPREVNVEVERVKVPICRDKFCRESASEISKIMLRDVDPCDDFYQYVCGNFGNVYPTNQSVPLVSTYSLMQSRLIGNLASILESLVPATLQDAQPHPHDVAAAFYQGCVANADNDDKEEAKKWVDEFGGWPLLGGNATEEDQYQVKDIIKSNSFALAFLDLKVLFDVDILPDFLNPKGFVITISKGGASSTLRSTYTNTLPDISYVNDLEIFKRLIKSAANLLDPDSQQLPNFESDIDGIVALETQQRNIKSFFAYNMLPRYSALGSITSDAIRQTKVKLSKLNNEVTLPDGISWVDVVKSLMLSDFPQFGVNSSMVNDGYEVIADVSTLKQMTSILTAKDINLRTIRNWFVWKVLARQLPKLSKGFRDEIFKVSSPQPTDAERCAEEVNYLMPYATVDIYDRYYWSSEPGKKELVLGIVDQLKAQIQEIFRNSDWLDDEAKEQLKIKLEKIIPFVGFPDWIKDAKQLADYYPIKLQDAHTYFDVNRQLLELKWSRDVNKLKDTFLRTNYWINPNLLAINAWYTPFVNSLTIPLGYLDFPLLASTGQPRSVVFGNLAHTIAHEIFHAFDPKGILFDGDGQLSSYVIKENTVQRYQERLQCLINQYDEGSNGTQTITEDFPDNAAMEVIFKAYRNTSLLYDDLLPDLELSKEKQLFVSYASSYCINATESMMKALAKDVHSPNKFRVLVPLSNSDEFAKVFQCSSGSKMNPSSKCRMF